MVASVVYIRICILNLKVLYLHINFKNRQIYGNIRPRM
nr:MAG TPA: hypothetical protein [Caudoviricetes sp.]DAS22283.1 MAG TPA: hypothetical protein [Caudoviricetes sp.]DAW64594.1 MAG TPA: hypothetical protein [Herelleviridae sp.]